jgi:hypothetical protein
MNALQKSHEMLSQASAEAKRRAPAHYESFVQFGHFEVNDFEMCYEIHGAGNQTPLVTIPPFWAVARVFPLLTKGR